MNYSNVNDEFNLVTHPVFAGYPYFHKENVPTCGVNSVTAPKNNSALNSGVVELPPAVRGMINNLVNVAISGPIYNFDRSLASVTKFPPHLNQSGINFGFQSNQIFISILDTTNVTVIKTQEVGNSLFSAKKVRSPLQVKYRPERALYILNYAGFYSTNNPSVYRVDYIGDCHLAVSIHKRLAKNSNLDISISNLSLGIQGEGQHEIKIFDPAGKLCVFKTGMNSKEYFLEELGKESGLKFWGIFTGSKNK